MSNPFKFHLPKHHTYSMSTRLRTHPLGLTEDQIPDKHMAMDCIFIAAIGHGTDGSYEQLHASLDGDTKKPMTSKELFRVWIMMSKMLVEDEDLHMDHRGFAARVYNAYTQAQQAAAGVAAVMDFAEDVAASQAGKK